MEQNLIVLESPVEWLVGGFSKQCQTDMEGERTLYDMENEAFQAIFDGDHYEAKKRLSTLIVRLFRNDNKFGHTITAESIERWILKEDVPDGGGYRRRYYRKRGGRSTNVFHPYCF